LSHDHGTVISNFNTGDEQMPLDNPSANTESENTSMTEQRTVTYSVKDDQPRENPDVLLLFHGLLWFTFHGTDECQIGIHNTTKGNILTHRYPHELEITIWTITGCDTAQRTCTPKKFRIGNPKTIEGIQIDVNNPKPNSTGVHVYQHEPFNRPPHSQDQNDPKDWRWVLDFEQEPFYRDGIKLKPEKVNPVISINHGLFYTLHKTTTTFDLLPGSGAPVPIGNVAQYIGGNIDLENNGEVTITIRRSFPHESDRCTLKWIAGTCYQIDITNDCFKDNERCYFKKPEDPNHKKDRNDFYLYYDCFDVPSGFHEIGLKKSGSAQAERLPAYVCQDETHTKEYIKSNNDSPCGSVVAGRGGNG
jgi:hypothetical protein